MKSINVVVTGESSEIKALIKAIGYGPDETITHRYQPADQDHPVMIKMEFGSLQVDEDHRIDFFGGDSPELFEFVASRPNALMTGMIIVFNADHSPDLDRLDQTIRKHSHYLKKYAMVIGITGADYTLIKQTEEQVRSILQAHDQVAPIFSIDSGLSVDVNVLVESLLCFANPGIQENTKKQISFAP